MKSVFLFIITLFSLLGCYRDKKPFSVTDFNILSNLNSKDSMIYLPVNLDDAVLNGIVIPSKGQTQNGYFNFSFKIKNTTGRLQRFFYKIYYQNETYKFNPDNKLATENFYGSWENNSYFKASCLLEPGQETVILDSFKIVGNPRNEKIFYGSDPLAHLVNDASIQKTIDYIKTVPDWMSKIIEKSKTSKINMEQQLYMDALWLLNDRKQKDSTFNNRWKRNPRMGLYKFMLVISSASDLEKLPEEVKDISKKDLTGNFINPFTYFSKYDTLNLDKTLILNTGKKINVSAKINLSRGIYINPLTVTDPNYTRAYFNSTCSDSVNKYSKAQIELFFHNINREYVLHNIPEIRDVTGENFTRKEYEELVKKFANSKNLIDTYVNSTACPCKNTVKENDGILIKNPGNKKGEFKKEHVGLQTRIGFTYGKFTAKIKFAELLSKDHVWNGITNAFWMMAQDVNANWNMRRPCNSDIAYIPKTEPDTKESEKHSKRQITYSEIDFEILKESEFWPATSYKLSNVPYKTDDCGNNQDIMVTCTNWDMACHQPEAFNIGAVEHMIDGTKYIHHRWETYYKALTTKVRANHDEIFKAPYYYFQIEWYPEKIIWRIGPEKDQMKIICVMDKNVSAIPNNQMLMIITQEWHNQEWWPLAPYKQNFIPFPKNDIIGKVLELEIE